MLHNNSLRRILVVLIALIVSGCDTKQDLQTGDSAPEFSVSDMRGERIRLSQFKGKIVVLYFWRNSCCSDGLKRIEPLYRANRHNNFEIVAVNGGDTKEAVAAYAKSNGLTFAMVPDEQLMLVNQYHVIGFPTIFILDKHGLIREKIMGAVQTEQLEKLLQRQFGIQKAAEAAYEKTHVH